MFLVNSAMVDLSIGTAGLIALLGYGVVFVGLIALMCVILIEGRIMVSSKKEAAAPAPAAPAAAPKPVLAAAAPGTAGELKLYDTDDRTAAMIMAIVADETGIPINELRFKSIREVKD